MTGPFVLNRATVNYAATSAYVWPAWNTVNMYATAATTWAQWHTPSIDELITSAAGTSAITIQESLGAWQWWNNAAPMLYVPTRRTAEQDAALHAEWKRKKEAEAAAKLKARQLLFNHLTVEQRKEVEREQHFHLRTRSGRLFRLEMGRGRHGNIKELVDGRIVRSFCAAPEGAIPEDDAILGQALALQFSEEDFLRVANARAA